MALSITYAESVEGSPDSYGLCCIDWFSRRQMHSLRACRREADANRVQASMRCLNRYAFGDCYGTCITVDLWLSWSLLIFFLRHRRRQDEENIISQMARSKKPVHSEDCNASPASERKKLCSAKWYPLRDTQLSLCIKQGCGVESAHH